MSDTASGPRAGFGARLGASILDGLLFLAVAIPLLFIDPVLYYTVALLGQALYFSLLEGGRAGQTLGKKALGIRVVDFNTGGPIGGGRGFLRYIGRIPSSIFFLGYLWMLWDPQKQTWHDKIAGTVVVPTSSYPVS
jgi:uncharacterized RDD family membrane protein YckC